MHQYLDGDISSNSQMELKRHLGSCNDCNRYFLELKKTIALVQSTSHIEAPEGFTEKVLALLPKENRKVGFQRWFRHHPLLSAASVFLLLMGGSFLSLWQQDHKQFAFTKQPELQVENHTVIVPEGEVVKGDLVVKNGNIRIEGEVQGNVTIVNGEKYMASAGNVTGEIEEVDQTFEWIWFNIKSGVSELFN